MFSPQGPSLRELAVQALSSVEHGYDLLAPKFDHTPFRTPDRVLDAVAETLAPLGPFGDGLDVCCGTGAGLRVLEPLCRSGVTGVDFSGGMLEAARKETAGSALPSGDVHWVQADVRAMPFTAAFDLAVSFGAFGHFLPSERPGLFAGVRRSLRPGGLFAFPIGAPPPVTSPWHWMLAGFDAGMRVRNLLWRPPFVMYYRTFPLAAVLRDLRRAGFDAGSVPLEGFGRRADGSPRCRLVLARRPDSL
ncbi:class I SAM-dependent methyltransferase [Actinacidiphila rubida]|uniref:Methyltransferase domain-containing protein n=1 Tax=Actinacidiphila rubida TaxID=310780 RepID=A0A1H8RQP3_9ACTN|nr:class I SAM-dependent methyltransferase [Actinacidiphila rubida]SEO68662.1 Methyltransferase domain-containing protein [Actinacidiphila rubida]